MSNPTDPQPRDVPWTGKTSAGNYYDRKYFEAESAVDWLGNRFHVGELVAYAIGAGRGQMMAVGEVLKIRYYHDTKNQRRKARDDEGPETEGYRDYEYDGKMFRWVWERVGVIEVEVQVITRITSGNWDNKDRTRPSWPNPMNITAMPLTAGSASKAIKRNQTLTED